MFTKILVPLDRSPLAEQALGPAAAIARASHAALDIVLAHEPAGLPTHPGAPLPHDDWTAEHEYVQAMAARFAGDGTLAVTHALLRGAAARMITQRARDAGADLIVMTSHGRTGVSRFWLGSVADAVVRQSPIPVLLIRAAEPTTDRFGIARSFRRVLVPLDGSPLAAEALAPAATFARAMGASLTLLRVIRPVPLLVFDAGMPYMMPPSVPDDAATGELVEDAEQQIEEVAARIAESDKLSVDAHVVVGEHVADEIIAFAHRHEIDCLALSTHGRGASRLLLGSIADKLIRGSGLPILLRRPVTVSGEAPLVTSEAVVAQLPALAGAASHAAGETGR